MAGTASRGEPTAGTASRDGAPMQYPQRRRPRPLLLVPALLPLLLAIALASLPRCTPQLPPDHEPVYPYADDVTDMVLEDIFTFAYRAVPSQENGLWRYDRPPAPHSSLAATTGTVLVQRMDNPKEPVGPWREDVLTVVPSPGSPASLTVRVAMEARHHGMNRLQLDVFLSTEVCDVDEDLLNRTMTNMTMFENTTWTHTCSSEACCPRQPGYDSAPGVVTAWVGKHGDPSTVIRNVQLSTVDYLGEWVEVDADFYVLPEEDGAGDDGAALYIRFGDPSAREGAASLTSVRLTAVPMENVNWLKPLSGAPPPPDGGMSAAAVLTNGLFAPDVGQTWYQIVGMGEEVSFSVELFGTFMVCSTTFEFSPGTQTYEYEFYLSSSNQGGVWTSVLLVDERAELDAHGAQGWVPTAGPRYFPCQLAKRTKLTLRKTWNFIYSMTEFALHGYDMATSAPCEKQCRHGGTCRYFGEPCRCVPKFGWRGAACEVDIDECALSPQHSLATDLSIIHGNAGCGSGDSSASKCTNTYGGFTCACYHGYTGPTTYRAAQQCVDVNECIEEGPALMPGGATMPKGGCDHICINLVGKFGGRLETTHICDCQQGFELLDNNRTCGPKCSQRCQHGSVCVSPEKCAMCDHGWQGDYCEFPLCSNEVEVMDTATGEWVVQFGCYHGGMCKSVGECDECLGGWSGVDCGYFGYLASFGLFVAVCGLLLMLPILVFVGMRKSWLPFQERGFGLMVNSILGCMLWTCTAPACGNPRFFGIRMVADTVQPESQLWSLWMPYTLGFSWYITCVTIRMRNLLLIHLKGEMPFTIVIQLPLSIGFFAAISMLSGTTQFAVWTLVLVGLFLYFLMTSIQLLPLRHDIDDIVINMTCGLVSILAMIGLFLARTGGADYENPDGLVGSFFPLVFAITGTLHIVLTHGRLAFSLRKAPKKEMISKYFREEDSYSDDEEEGQKKFGAKWKKALLVKSKAVVAVADTVGNADSEEEYEEYEGSDGETKKRKVKAKKKVGSGSESSGSSSSEPESSSQESESEKEETPENKKKCKSKKEEKRDPEDLNDVGGTAARAVGGGRGASRGAAMAARGGRGRGRGWNRSSRGRASGRARGRIRLPAISLQASHAAAVAIAQPRTTAQLWSAVKKKGEAEVDSDSESEDSELEELAAEVKNFEKMVESRKTRGKDGNTVPSFQGKTWGDSGGGGSTLDGFSVAMRMQDKIMQQQADTWGGDGTAHTTSRPFSAPLKKTQLPGSAGVGRPATAGVSRGSGLPGQPGSPTQAQAWSSGPSKDDDEPSGWLNGTREELVAWLESCRATEWVGGLAALGVEKLADMVDVEEADLEELGIKPVPRRRIMRAIATIGNSGGGAQAVEADAGANARAAAQSAAAAVARVASARPQSAPAWKHAQTKLSAASALGGKRSDLGASSQRPASAAPVRSGWGSNELERLQAQARDLEEDSSSDEDDDVDLPPPTRPGHVRAKVELVVDEASDSDQDAEDEAFRPRQASDNYPGDTRAARKGAQAQETLAAAKVAAADLTTSEYDSEYDSDPFAM